MLYPLCAMKRGVMQDLLKSAPRLSLGLSSKHVTPIGNFDADIFLNLSKGISESLFNSNGDLFFFPPKIILQWLNKLKPKRNYSCLIRFRIITKLAHTQTSKIMS